jgi:hypothetical protein
LASPSSGTLFSGYDLEAAARPHECQMLRCGTAGEQRERVGIGAWDLFERDFRHSIRKTARW